MRNRLKGIFFLFYINYIFLYKLPTICWHHKMFPNHWWRLGWSKYFEWKDARSFPEDDDIQIIICNLLFQSVCNVKTLIHMLFALFWKDDHTHTSCHNSKDSEFISKAKKKKYRKIGNSSGMFSFPSGLSQGRSRIVTRQPCKKSYHFTAHRWSLVQESGIVLQATIPLTLCRFNTGSWDLLDFWGQAVVLLLHSEEHQWSEPHGEKGNERKQWQFVAVGTQWCPKGSGTAPDRSYHFWWILDTKKELFWNEKYKWNLLALLLSLRGFSKFFRLPLSSLSKSPALVWINAWQVCCRLAWEISCHSMWWVQCFF